MFDYRTEMLVQRLERERRFKALSLTAARAGDRPGSRPGLPASPFDELRAGVASGLTRLALVVHREAAVDAVVRPQLTEVSQ